MIDMTMTLTPETESVRIREVRATSSKLFAERGYAGTSMKDIGDALGIQAPSLYNYVKSKQEILDGILLTTMRGMHAALRDGLSVSTEVREQVRCGMEEQVRFRLYHANEVLTMSRETLNLSPEVRVTVLELRDEQRAMWKAVVDRGVEQGVFSSPNTELTSQLLHDMCSWIQIKHFWVEQQTPESHLVHWYSSSALRMVEA